MLHLLAAASAALLVGSAPSTHVTAASARVSAPPTMMKFMKDLFPNMEKPDFSNLEAPDFSSFTEAVSNVFSPTPAEPLPEIDVKGPNPGITTAGKGMPALAPIFNVEADLQAAITNLGSYDEEEVQEEISVTANSAPVVVYTYGLSPFSTETLAVLESTGCQFENVQLGLEWFALGPKGSATRVELRKMYGQGSLPHVFIGGEWVGGLATGGEGGLAGLVERDELVDKLRAAKAL